MPKTRYVSCTCVYLFAGFSTDLMSSRSISSKRLVTDEGCWSSCPRRLVETGWATGSFHSKHDRFKVRVVWS